MSISDHNYDTLVEEIAGMAQGAQPLAGAALAFTATTPLEANDFLSYARVVCLPHFILQALSTVASLEPDDRCNTIVPVGAMPVDLELDERVKEIEVEPEVLTATVVSVEVTVLGASC